MKNICWNFQVICLTNLRDTASWIILSKICPHRLATTIVFNVMFFNGNVDVSANRSCANIRGLERSCCAPASWGYGLLATTLLWAVTHGATGCPRIYWPPLGRHEHTAAAATKKMVFTQEDRILIKVLRQEKGYNVLRFKKEFPNKHWCQRSLHRLIDQIDRHVITIIVVPVCQPVRAYFRGYNSTCRIS